MAADQTRLSETLKRFIEIEFEKLKAEITHEFIELKKRREMESLAED